MDITLDNEQYGNELIKHIAMHRVSLLKEVFEYMGFNLGENKLDTIIQYNKNDLLPESSEYKTLDEGIIFKYSDSGDFPLPQIVKKYVKEAIKDDRVNEKALPLAPLVNKERIEDGIKIYKAIKKIMPKYSAMAITGALWVECGWKTNVYNTLEASDGGVGGTSGMAGCGEGWFGLTFWEQKKKIIDRLNPPGVSHDASTYRRPNTLSDLDEKWWAKILESYLKYDVPKHYKILKKGKDKAKVLYASYLFKAAGGVDINFDNMDKIVNRYMSTHERQGSAHAYNGFAHQIIASLVLSYYIKKHKVPKLKDIKI